jgi:hypothetical protein
MAGAARHRSLINVLKSRWQLVNSAAYFGLPRLRDNGCNSWIATSHPHRSVLSWKRITLMKRTMLWLIVAAVPVIGFLVYRSRSGKNLDVDPHARRD